MSTSASRMPLIDALKGVAAQCILLHHLAIYGPLGQALRQHWPELGAVLFDYGRMTVQVFLVIAGFLAARTLSPDGQALSRFPLGLLWKRYVRLVVPFMVAISLAVICAAIADHWLDDDMVPARAELGQWLAHVTLLHGVLGVESLSAGVWYVAIDFQLFALFALLLWAGRHRWLAPALVLVLGVASLFVFNRNTELDNWAVYFFAAYTLGALAWWISGCRQVTLWLGVMFTVVILALIVDFRLRIALALACALLLAVARRSGLLGRWPERPTLAFLGQISYAVFLVHFPVLLLMNAGLPALAYESPEALSIAIGVTWLVCLGASVLFYRHVEQPAAIQRIQGWLSLGPNILIRFLARRRTSY